MKSAAKVSTAVGQINKLQSDNINAININATKIKLPEGDISILLIDLMSNVKELTNKVKELQDKFDSLETVAE